MRGSDGGSVAAAAAAAAAAGVGRARAATARRSSDAAVSMVARASIEGFWCEAPLPMPPVFFCVDGHLSSAEEGGLRFKQLCKYRSRRGDQGALQVDVSSRSFFCARQKRFRSAGE